MAQILQQHIFTTVRIFLECSLSIRGFGKRNCKLLQHLPSSLHQINRQIDKTIFEIPAGADPSCTDRRTWNSNAPLSPRCWGKKGIQQQEMESTVQGNPKEGGGPILTRTKTNPAEAALFPGCTCDVSLHSMTAWPVLP